MKELMIHKILSFNKPMNCNFILFQGAAFAIAAFFCNQAYGGSPRATAVDRISVAIFTEKAKEANLNSLWAQKKLSIQQDIIAGLQDSFNFEVSAVSKNRSSKEYRGGGVEGILEGEFKGSILEMSLKSSATGKNLASWVVPVTITDRGKDDEMVAQAVRSVVTGFPYLGIVTAVEGTKITLNMGKTRGFSVGTQFKVFEFEGDQPSFSSSKKYMATITVTEVGAQSVIAKVNNTDGALAPFLKVEYSKPGVDLEDRLSTRTHRKFWIGGGTQFFFLDVKVSSLEGALSKRIYQVPLSPFSSLELGYSGFKATGIFGGAANDSNTVKFLQTSASFEFAGSQNDRRGTITSLGAYYANYNVTTNQGATLPLVSSQLISPLLERRYQWALGTRAILWLTGQLYYPIYSSDVENGATMPYTSGGVGINGGTRMYLNKTFAVEAGLDARVLREALANATGSLIEAQYGFSIKLLALF